MIEVGQIVRGTVEKLIFGGSGLIRYDHWVIFVPDVATGEEVDVLLIEKKKSYFLASLVGVIKKSALRIQPQCPYFGTCGGCQMQHLEYSEHLRLKVDWLKESFERIAKITLPEPIACSAANKRWAYRRKIILHVRKGHIGYFGRDGHSLLEIALCPIFSSEPAFFSQLRECISWFSEKEIDAEIAVLNGFNGKVSLRFCFEMAVPKNAKDVYDRAKNTFSNWEFLWFEEAKPPPDDTFLEEIVDGLTLFYSPRVFIQNYPEQSMQIYKDVLAMLQDDNGPILDLYSGIGILSLLLARGGRKVLGIELNQEAVRLAKKSAACNALENAEFRSAFAEDIDRIKGLSRYKTWIINPPRTGLSPKVVQIILRYKPKRLIYISCMPPTLARDIKALCEGQYSLEKAAVYDMFPQTTHLETVVSLRNLATSFPERIVTRSLATP